MIRRFAFLVFASTLLAACGKDPTAEPEWLRLTQQEVLLRGEANSEATFTVTALGEWSLKTESTAFEATPAGGGAGSTVVTVRAASENSGKVRRQLGQLTLRYEANGIQHSVEVLQSPRTAPQTVLLYMPGRDLESFYEKNIAGIRSAVNVQVPGDGRMLVCWQPETLGAAELLEIHYDYGTQQSALLPLKSYPEFASDDPACVAQMLTDAAALAPAERYGLIIGCHGKGWVPAAQGILQSKVLRPGEPREESIWTPTPGALVTRSFGDPRNEIDIEPFAQALEGLPFRLDYLIFDACFMASIEVIYDLRRAVDFFIASPCEIMGAGFPYARALPHLFAEEGASRDLQRVCEEFFRFYNDDWESVDDNARSGCISLAVMSEIEPLAEVVRRINDHGTQAFESGELQYYEGMRTHLFYDLGHWVELACGDAALKADFAAQLDKAFPPACRLATPSFYSVYFTHEAPGPGSGMHPVKHYSGVSTSEPSPKYADDNRRTAWYLRTHGN